MLVSILLFTNCTQQVKDVYITSPLPEVYYYDVPKEDFPKIKVEYNVS